MTSDEAEAFWEPPTTRAKEDYDRREWAPIRPPDRARLGAGPLQYYILIREDGSLYSQHRTIQKATETHQQSDDCPNLKLWDRRYGWRLPRATATTPRVDPRPTAWERILQDED
jgi:hypothetical protein